MFKRNDGGVVVNCQPMSWKLSHIVVRVCSFSREIRSRFKKQVIKPYVGSNGSVQIEEINRLLSNIGRSDDRLSLDEQQILLKEAGSTNRSLSIAKMMELIG